jgi:hypothetical protein
MPSSNGKHFYGILEAGKLPVFRKGSKQRGKQVEESL